MSGFMTSYQGQLAILSRQEPLLDTAN